MKSENKLINITVGAIHELPLQNMTSLKDLGKEISVFPKTDKKGLKILEGLER